MLAAVGGLMRTRSGNGRHGWTWRALAGAALLVAVSCGSDVGDLPVGAPREGPAPIPTSHRHQSAPPDDVAATPGEDAAPPDAADDGPPEGDVVLVDHVWVRDAETVAETARRRRLLERLRGAVERGASFEAAWNGLGEPGDAWHVAEGETYPVAVLPDAARDLPVGTLSPIIPGDGGLHLFRILGRHAADEHDD